MTIAGNATMFLGRIRIKRINPITARQMRSKIITLFGREGLKRRITSGRVTNIATPNEDNNALDTTIGIGLINSPIIPVERRSGTNAQTVVRVVVKIAVLKSRHTKRPV